MPPCWLQNWAGCWAAGKKCHNQAERLAHEGLIQERARVLRGGSWNNNRNNARCSYRNRNEPDNFNNNNGFRVVCSTSLVSLPEMRCGVNCSAEALNDG